MYPDPLLQALGIAGDLQALARHLHVPKKQLGSWLAGETETPPAIVVRAISFLQRACRMPARSS
jgi:hypothetical protein